jgi:hypothetical protein
MFLNDEEIFHLTGFRQKSRQATQLKAMGIPFFVNAAGHPVVTKVAVEGGKLGTKANKQIGKEWTPSWAGKPT